MALRVKLNLSFSEYGQVITAIMVRVEDMEKFIENNPAYREMYANDIKELKNIIERMRNTPMKDQ